MFMSVRENWDCFVSNLNQRMKSNSNSLKRISLDSSMAMDSETDLNYIGDHFKYVNREKSSVSLIKQLFKVYKLRKFNFEKSKRDLYLPISTGLSGIGKSKFARMAVQKFLGLVGNGEVENFDDEKKENGDPAIREIYKDKIFMKELETVINLRVDVNLQVSENIRNRMGVSVLFQWSKYLFSSMKGKDTTYNEAELKHRFDDEFRKYDDSDLNFKNVIEKIMEVTGQPIFLNLDEIQQSAEKNVLNQLIEDVAMILSNEKLNCLHVVMTGIHSVSILNSFVASGVEMAPIALPPLDMIHIQEIIKTLFPHISKGNHYWDHLLYLTGGIPRHLEYLLRTIFGDKCKLTAKEINAFDPVEQIANIELYTDILHSFIDNCKNVVKLGTVKSLVIDNVLALYFAGEIFQPVKSSTMQKNQPLNENMNIGIVNNENNKNKKRKNRNSKKEDYTLHDAQYSQLLYRS